MSYCDARFEIVHGKGENDASDDNDMVGNFTIDELGANLSSQIIRAHSLECDLKG